MKKITSTLALLVLTLLPSIAFGQFDNIETTATDFSQTMRRIAPLVFIIALIGGALFNIGKVWGENRDWKAFFTSIGIFVLAVTIIIGLVTWLSGLSV